MIYFEDNLLSFCLFAYFRRARVLQHRKKRQLAAMADSLQLVVLSRMDEILQRVVRQLYPVRREETNLWIPAKARRSLVAGFHFL